MTAFSLQARCFVVQGRERKTKNDNVNGGVAVNEKTKLKVREDLLF